MVHGRAVGRSLSDGNRGRNMVGIMGNRGGIVVTSNVGNWGCDVMGSIMSNGSGGNDTMVNSGAVC